MSIKHYGIYLAYAPEVDLRNEGLGRYLAAFLKGAAGREDVRFVLVCPSWSREGLEDLFASEGVPKDRFKIFSPKEKPLVLRGYQTYQAYKKRPWKPSLRQRLAAWGRGVKDAFMKSTERSLVQAHSFSALPSLLLRIGFLTVIALVLSPLYLIKAVIFWVGVSVCRRNAHVFKPLFDLKFQLQRALGSPKGDVLVLRLYQQMEEAESKRMRQLIDDLPYVRAWYSPTAFWPAFNEIRAPKLMCVPDVVLTDFPVGFSDEGGDRRLAAFAAIESAIRTGRNFVAYSEAIKWETLVDRYAVRAANVTVIHHAPNDLSRWVMASGFYNVAASSHHYSEWLLSCALQKSFNPAYTNNFLNGSVKFLFYASQFRPNKNLISLLTAYEYLLRKRLIGHKLILTGNTRGFPPVREFISRHFLENDVLCLHGLKVQELAACYKLADLAVNPSLSEGGCPFTFTEALSVDTPVVMARIPVTEEVLTDAELQEVTFFDPYDWKDMAHRIEWALNHRDQLLIVQRKTYAELSRRSWADVANEHIELLEQISNASDHPGALKVA